MSLLKGRVSGAAEKDNMSGGPLSGCRGWRNVAAQPMAISPAAAANHGQENQADAAAYLSAKNVNNTVAGSTRSRSNTSPGRPGMSMHKPPASMAMAVSVQGQQQMRSKEGADRGVRKGSRKRVRAPLGPGGRAAGRGFRKSVENW